MARVIPDNIGKNVPAGIKRVASAFQTGLDDSCTAWFEPPYARDSSPPHFVLLLPDRGIIALEVLEVRPSGVLGTLRGKLRIKRDDGEADVENPLARAQDRAKSLSTLIASDPRFSDIRVAVAAAAVFPNLELEDAKQKRLDRHIDLEKCIFKSDLNTAIQDTGSNSFLQVCNRILGTDRLSEPIPEAKEKLLRSIVRPETIIKPIASTANGVQLTIFRPGDDGDDIIKVMDRQQESLAKGLGVGHRVIRGVAGSGKTLILAFRARLLAHTHRSKRVLVACYTTTLATELRAMLTEDNVEVSTLDQVMSQIIRAAGLRDPGFREDESGEQRTAIALQALARGVGQRYAAVLLDEAQDFSTSGLRFAVGLLDPGSDDLLVVADAAQNIFRRQFTWSAAGIQAQGRTRILRTNYRNTREILEFASKFLLASTVIHAEEVPDFDDENAVIPPESAARSGPHPITIFAKTAQEETSAVVSAVESIMSVGRGPKDVAILYAAKSGSVQDDIYRSLESRGLSTLWVKDKESKKLLAHAQQQVVISTIASAKGLEFPHVVLCSIWNGHQELETNRKTAYVGMTRATQTLTVIAREDIPFANDLRR